MIIKKYRDIPVTYAPDIGAVVMARLSAAAVWLKAVVIYVRRRQRDLELKVQWLEGHPDPGGLCDPIEEGTLSWVYASPDGWPPMIKQITKGQQD